jgi:putative aldouronate transport system substrate-binding protein
MSDFRPLMTGFIDFDENYPGFIAKLKAAGIDEYVAEVQVQIDAFLAQ